MTEHKAGNFIWNVDHDIKYDHMQIKKINVIVA